MMHVVHKFILHILIVLILRSSQGGSQVDTLPISRKLVRSLTFCVVW